MALCFATLAVGVALGYAVFWLTGGHEWAWPVTVTRTASGWRLSSPIGLQQNVMDLDDAHLLWQNGSCLELLDLESGKVTVLQPPIANGWGHDVGVASASFASASVAEPYAAWIMPSVSEDHESLIVRDLRSGSQETIARASQVEGVFTSAGRVAWQQGGTVFSRDMSTGRTSVIASAVDGGLLGMDGPLLAWTTLRGPGGQPLKERVTAHVRNLDTGGMLSVRIGKLDTLDGLQLAGRSLVFATRRPLDDSHTVRLLWVIDCRDGRRRLVTRDCWWFAADSRSLVWNQPPHLKTNVWAQALKGGAVRRAVEAERLAMRMGGAPLWSDAFVAGVPQDQTVVEVVRRKDSGSR